MGNKAFVGAYQKGIKAFRDGEPIEHCPYSELTATVNRGREVVTYGREFAKCWKRGWKDAEAGCDCQKPPMPEDDTDWVYYISNDCPIHGDDW